jgi:hypothetical protein
MSRICLPNRRLGEILTIDRRLAWLARAAARHALVESGLEKLSNHIGRESTIRKAIAFAE